MIRDNNFIFLVYAFNIQYTTSKIFIFFNISFSSDSKIWSFLNMRGDRIVNIINDYWNLSPLKLHYFCNLSDALSLHYYSHLFKLIISTNLHLDNHCYCMSLLAIYMHYYCIITAMCLHYHWNSFPFEYWLRIV